MQRRSMASRSGKVVSDALEVFAYDGDKGTKRLMDTASATILAKAKRPKVHHVKRVEIAYDEEESNAARPANWLAQYEGIKVCVFCVIERS